MSLVKLRGPLKKLADDTADHSLDGATVSELLRALERAHPAVAGWILDERGLVRRHIKVFVNGESVSGDATVGPDDTIDVLPAISGG